MSKKKHAAEHVNHERWLVSYADFITLLFAFFVVMFASSQVDRSKTKKMALAINSAFETFAIFKDQSGDALEKEGGGSGGNAKKYREYLASPDSNKSIIMPAQIDSEETSSTPPKGDEKLSQDTGMITSQEEALARVQKTLMDMINKNKLDPSVEIHRDLRGLVISVRDAVVFEAGGDKLIPKSEATLKIIGPVISSLPNQIRVEGHTDNQNASGAFKSNWDLSTARAVHIIGWLLDNYKINPERFIAVGYGAYRPVADNATEDGRLKNRRVDIILLSDDVAKKEAVIPKQEELMHEAQVKAIPGNKEINIPEFKDKTKKDNSNGFQDKDKDKEIEEIRKLFKSTSLDPETDDEEVTNI
ncbi:MAG: hypothetical protein ACD_73C00256G0005 [uncultured bacterium]|nr:MAG: hypothetical protein ACD_73C00256G0005 [uncultured bacterium]